VKGTLIAVCLGLSGCAALTPAPGTSTNEVAPPRPATQRVTGAKRSAEQAIRHFAMAYINWNAQTIAADMRSLAAQSIGQARSAVQLAAAETAQDYELKQGGIANRGRVEAIAPLAGQRDRYVVVTLERTMAANTTAYQGLRPAWHVALATVTELGSGQWVISAWQPEI
jgi:hypothetical protein